jgi:hypothetical protein
MIGDAISSAMQKPMEPVMVTEVPKSDGIQTAGTLTYCTEVFRQLLLILWHLPVRSTVLDERRVPSISLENNQSLLGIHLDFLFSAKARTAPRQQRCAKM